MPNDNLQTLNTAEVLPDSYIQLRDFIDQVNALTPAEVQALIDLRAKVNGLVITHEGAIDPDFC